MDIINNMTLYENPIKENNSKSSVSNIVFNKEKEPKPSKSNILEDLIENDDFLSGTVNNIFSKSLQEHIKTNYNDLSNSNKTNSSSNSFNTKLNYTKNEKLANQNAYGNKEARTNPSLNKCNFKLEELLESEMDSINLEENFSKKIILKENDESQKKTKNELFNDVSKNENPIINTSEILNNILKDQVVPIEPNIIIPLFDKNKINKGRIISPLDEEEHDEEDINFGSLNNYKISNLNENIKNDNKEILFANHNKNETDHKRFLVNSEHEHSHPANLIFSTPLKNPFDTELDGYTFKKEVKESDTPFNTPINQMQDTETIKALSDIRLGIIIRVKKICISTLFVLFLKKKIFT